MMEIKQQHILEERNDKQLLYCYQENVHFHIIIRSCVSIRRIFIFLILYIKRENHLQVLTSVDLIFYYDINPKCYLDT